MGLPFIVMCAPNGARRLKADHPALPLTPVEIAQCAGDLLQEGASILHLHVRDDDGAHSLDADRYRAAIAAIRERVGDQLIIQVTTEACGIYSPEQQIALVRELEPEAVSLALRELCGGQEAEPAASRFFHWLVRSGIKAQYILYSAEDVRRFEALRRRGIIADEKPFVLFVLGRYSSNLTGDAGELDAFIAAAAPDTTWAVCCFGPTEQQAVCRAAALGGHARVGFENNLLLADGGRAEDNAALVRQAVLAGNAESRAPATADLVRELFA